MKIGNKIVFVSSCLLGVVALAVPANLSWSKYNDLFYKTDAGENNYTMTLSSFNAPSSPSGQLEVVGNTSTNAVAYLEYVNATTSENYHIALATGGSISNYEPMQGLSYIAFNGSGSITFMYGQSIDDLYVVDEYVLGETPVELNLAVNANYWCIKATSDTTLKSVDFAYSCQLESPKIMVEISRLALDGSEIAAKERYFYEESSVNSVYTIEPTAVDGFVKNKDYIKGIVEEHAYVDIHYSELDAWDGTSTSSELAGSGTVGDPYLINSGADLNYLRTQTQTLGADAFENEYFKMTRSIDLSNYTSGNFYIGEGGTTSASYYFAGNFDGNNCSIRGLNITGTDVCASLFTRFGNGSQTLSNLSLYGSITGGNMTGGFSARAQGTLTNLTNYATVTKTTSANGVGGVVSEMTGDINNCVNYGTVTNTNKGSKVGGIVCSMIKDESRIYNCYNFGTVQAEYFTVSNNTYSSGSGIGGIVGHLYATDSSPRAYVIENCVNGGKVVGCSKIGGILGMYDNRKATSTFLNCKNYGAISASEELAGNIIPYIGGLAGTINLTLMQNCVNYGDVTAYNTSKDAYAGGLISYISSSSVGKVSYCDNYGIVRANKRVGGITSFQSVDIEHCNNYGDIICPESGAWVVGGITGGTALDVEINYCNNYGNIQAAYNSSTNIVGGILGHTGGGLNGEINNCVNYGDVSGYKFVAGIIATTAGGSGTLQNYTVTVTNCKNEGKIYGNRFVAGIFSWINSQGGANALVNCVNNGEITGDTMVGELYGDFAS